MNLDIKYLYVVCRVRHGLIIILNFYNIKRFTHAYVRVFLSFLVHC